MPHMGCDLSAKTISGLLGTKFDSPNYAIYTGYNLTPCLVLFFFLLFPMTIVNSFSLQGHLNATFKATTHSFGAPEFQTKCRGSGD